MITEKISKKLDKYDYLEIYPLHGETMDRLPNPTFDELIEAIGAQGYFSLKHINQGIANEREWEAEAPHKTLRLLVRATGETAEDAMALLWIELNKKI